MPLTFAACTDVLLRLLASQAPGGSRYTIKVQSQTEKYILAVGCFVSWLDWRVMQQSSYTPENLTVNQLIRVFIASPMSLYCAILSRTDFGGAGADNVETNSLGHSFGKQLD